MDLTQAQVDEFMAAEKIVRDASPLEWRRLGPAQILWHGGIEVGSAQVGQVTLYVNPNFLRRWVYALSLHGDVIYEIHVRPVAARHSNPPGCTGCPGRVTAREHEHIWIEGPGKKCARPLEGLGAASHRQILEEFCKRARIDFKPSYRDPVEGVQLQL